MKRMYCSISVLEEGNVLSSHNRREWVAFGFVVAFLGVATIKKIARGTANDAAANQHRASTITTLKEQFQKVTKDASQVAAAGKLQGKELTDQVKAEVERYQQDIQPSIERIQGNLNELSNVQSDMTEAKTGKTD
jgi:gas vesicle protein